MAVGAVSAGSHSYGRPAKAQQNKAEMDFPLFVEHAPDVVKEAVLQAAGESGFRIGGKMTHISQILLQQLNNQYKGVSNPMDVFGSSVASALHAAEKMLWNLEHPRSGGEAKSREVMQCQEQEKNFYRALVEKLSAQEGTQENRSATTTAEEVQNRKPSANQGHGAAAASEEADDVAQERMDYQKFLHEKIEELFVRFQNGESEPSYQIGAASFTEKEWDKLLEKFDKLEDEIRAQMREEHTKRAKKQEEQQEAVRMSVIEKEKKTAGTKEVQDTGFPTTDALLSGTYTYASYPPSELKNPPDYYITCYTEDGIFCRGKGEQWFIPLKNKEEYNKVMALINHFPSDWNLRFASKENFWRDFLDDKIDMDGFMQFMEGTDHGVPDYTITKGDSTYIDREKAQWAKYMNQGIGTFYTAQEMQQMQEEQMQKNMERLPKLSDLYGKIYKAAHPEYHGERMFCEYPGGPLYTADEIGKRMYENFLTQKTEQVVVI